MIKFFEIVHRKGFPFAMLSIIFFACPLTLLSQVKIDVKGQWNVTVPIVGALEAGLDYSFANSFESSPNQVTIDITHGNPSQNQNGNYKWSVHVGRSDTDWHPLLKLYAKRSGDGQWFWSPGNGVINDGTTYQEVTNVNTYFFRGMRTRLNIPIQYQLTGVSILLPAKTYSTTIIYTVTDGW